MALLLEVRFSWPVSNNSQRDSLISETHDSPHDILGVLGCVPEITEGVRGHFSHVLMEMDT
jgi:hypothetical protein